MISFTSFPNQKTEADYGQIHEDLMDLDDLEDLEGKGSKLTCPGEYLTSSQAYMRCGNQLLYSITSKLMRWDSGHGTYVDSEEVIASVAGTVERVNKLVTVRAVRSRSVGQVHCLSLSHNLTRFHGQVQSRGWRSGRRTHNWGKLEQVVSWSNKNLWTAFHRYSPGDGKWMRTQDRTQFLCYLPSICRAACRSGSLFFFLKKNKHRRWRRLLNDVQ